MILSNRLIPVLLLNGKGNSIIKTKKFKDDVYLGDCLNAVKIFNEKEVDELVIIDVSCSKNNSKPKFNLIESIASECFMPLAYGGGISNLEHAKKLFEIGVEKIIINSCSFNYDFIKELSNIYGAQSILVSIDYKSNFFGTKELYINSGKVKSNVKLDQHLKKLNEAGVGEIILHSISRDGMMNGYDIEMIKKVSSSIEQPLVALGGASEMNDFKDAIDSGASAVAAGSFFVFFGKHKAVLITYPKIEEIQKFLNISYEMQ